MTVNDRSGTRRLSKGSKAPDVLPVSMRGVLREPVTKRILVTGVPAFSSRISARACSTTATRCSAFFTGRRRNIAPLLDHESFELMRHDATFPLYVEVDDIYRLACPASPIRYQFDPVQTTKTSVIGAINMLGLAKRMQAKLAEIAPEEGRKMHALVE